MKFLSKSIAIVSFCAGFACNNSPADDIKLTPDNFILSESTTSENNEDEGEESILSSLKGNLPSELFSQLNLFLSDLDNQQKSDFCILINFLNGIESHPEVKDRYGENYYTKFILNVVPSVASEIRESVLSQIQSISEKISDINMIYDTQEELETKISTIIQELNSLFMLLSDKN